MVNDNHEFSGQYASDFVLFGRKSNLKTSGVDARGTGDIAMHDSEEGGLFDSSEDYSQTPKSEDFRIEEGGIYDVGLHTEDIEDEELTPQEKKEKARRKAHEKKVKKFLKQKGFTDKDWDD